MNVDKTNAVWIGSKIRSTDTVSNRIRLKWSCDFVLLGIYFNVDLKKMVEHNFNVAISKMENVIHLYQNVPLSLNGKVTVIKSLVIPKIVHVLQVLHVPGKKYIDKVNKLVRDFVWNNGKARISLKQLTKSYEEGGLRLTDLSTMNNAIKISWIKRLCMSEGGFQSIFSL